MITIKEIFEDIEKNGGFTPSRRVRDIATMYPDKVAFRDKRFGIWNESTYETFWNEAQYVGNALNHFGVNKNDKVAVHSENRPEWLIADVGIQSRGAVTVGLYPTNPAQEVKYLLGHSETKILFAEDQEQVDKALDVIDDLPGLIKIVYFEDRGLTRYPKDKLMSWDEFLSLGREEYLKNKDFINDCVDEIKSEDVAMLIYTSVQLDHLRVLC